MLLTSLIRYILSHVYNVNVNFVDRCKLHIVVVRIYGFFLRLCACSLVDIFFFAIEIRVDTLRISIYFYRIIRIYIVNISFREKRKPRNSVPSGLRSEGKTLHLSKTVRNRRIKLFVVCLRVYSSRLRNYSSIYIHILIWLS